MPEPTVLLLKATGENGRAAFGRGRWTVNRWRTVAGPLVRRRNGLHYCEGSQILGWLNRELWLFEDGSPDETVRCDDKMVTRRGRVVRRLDGWNDRTARLFAADCAEHVLHLFEEERPGDDRPRLAVEAARRFADGTIGAEELAAAREAAREAAAAAWEAARAAATAAWEAVGAAAWAPGAAAAWAAAAAAWEAARESAWAARAAREAEREWQYRRLLHTIGMEDAP